MIALTEADRQRALLTTPIGVKGSGRARYAAAMWFYERGDMTAEMLEIYRICCKFDHEDPIALAKLKGVQ